MNPDLLPRVRTPADPTVDDSINIETAEDGRVTLGLPVDSHVIDSESSMRIEYLIAAAEFPHPKPMKLERTIQVSDLMQLLEPAGVRFRAALNAGTDRRLTEDEALGFI